MKKTMAFILALVLALGCMPALAGGMEYTAAKEVITATVPDPFITAEPIDVTFTDLMMYWGMWMPIEGKPSENSPMDMYICDSNPNLIRWEDDEGNIVEIDLSQERPLNMIAYTAAGSSNVILFDSINFTATEISASGMREMELSELPFFIVATLFDGASGGKEFSIFFYNIDDLIAALAEADASAEGDASAEDNTADKESLCGMWVSTDLSYYMSITTDAIELRKMEITGSWKINPWKLTEGRITFQGGLPYDHFEYLDVVEENGYVHLVYEDCVFVTPEEYPLIADTYKLGETAVSESAEITVTKVDFTKLNKKMLPSGVSTDQKYMKICFTVTNNSKELFNIQEDVRFFVDYNDGFTYLTHVEPLDTVWIHPESGIDLTYHGSGGSSHGGFMLNASPLDTEKVEVYIPVPDKVASDTKAPLKIYVAIPNGDLYMGYCFVVR